MAGLLKVPLEIRNQVYDYLLHEPFEPRSRGVMIVSEKYVMEHLPQRCYSGLLGTCRQIHREFKEAIRHLSATKGLNYEFDITFLHGRPYLSLSWSCFPALSSVVNSMVIHVNFRLREPFTESSRAMSVPRDDDLMDLLDDRPRGFAHQLFDYIAILLKTLAGLMSHGDPEFSLLYTENITLNLRRPTHLVPVMGMGGTRRVGVDVTEAQQLDETMRTVLLNNVDNFGAYDAKDCDKLWPLIQIGTLRLSTEGVVWGQGNNLVLAENDFKWLRF